MKTFRLLLLLSFVVQLLPGATAKEKGDFKLYVLSRGVPEARIPAKKRELIPDSITLARLVKILGPGWVAPWESAGIVKWFFADDTLNVWPTTYGPDEIITFKGKGGRSRMWWDSTLIKKEAQKAEPTATAQRP